MNWDDLRIFLAVAREGSLSAAARVLGINQSTVSRRVTAFERRLGVRLFDRLPSGYAVTPAGTQMIAAAERIDEEVYGIGRRVLGQDLRLTGTLRVTSTDVSVNRFLMPHFAAFAQAHPDIELHIVTTYAHLNLARREADVAVRVTKAPPGTLIGRRLATMALGVYASRAFFERHEGRLDVAALPWVGWDNEEINRMYITDHFPQARIHHRVNDMLVMISAVKAGLGIATFPCCHVDIDPEMRRVVPGAITDGVLDMWLLTHPDVNRSARVRAFMDFMAEAISRDRDRIEGRRPLY